MTRTAPPHRNGAMPDRRRPKAAEMVAAELRRQIVAGELKPGDKLHAENVLRTRFEISRPTLREAMRLLEADSLIEISRGQHGGARVKSVDLDAATRQVGLFLQMERTTLRDVWLARTVIEPAAAGLLAALRPPAAFAELEFNIAQARDAADHDPIRYADLSAEFSTLITRHCGNKTLHLFASLMHQIIRRQHENVVARTLTRPGVDKLRQESIRSREMLLNLMRSSPPPVAHSFWLAHLEHMRDLVLAAYKGPVTLEVLDEPLNRLLPVANLKRSAPPSAKPPRAAAGNKW